jgi:hypothetical protein
VQPEQYTGNKISVLLADRCVRYLPEAIVQLRSPCYVGKVKVLVMKDPVYPLIIGNNVFQCDKSTESIVSDDNEDQRPVIKTVIFENSSRVEPNLRMNSVETGPLHVKQKSSDILTQTISQPVNSGTVDCDQSQDSHSDNAAAVQTRAQVKAESRAIRPLKHTAVDALNITPAEFKELQLKDETLCKYWQFAKENRNDDHKSQFINRDGILYSMYKASPHDDVIEQLVVPESLRERVVLYAHETTLSGHMGISSTYKKLCSCFFIPGALQLCKRIIHSCLKCQQGANRATGGKAPLRPLPICSTPFEKVFIDLVGKIEPASAEGHCYILTILDSATHFIIAVPLKRTDSVTIAEALMKQFDLVGYPQQIYNDNGSNLSADIMREIYRVFGIQMKTIPVYWPRVNLVERQHGIIKSIMRKLICDQPRQWHRYLDALMFAIRTTPNVSGYSPFELLFGRQGRTHLTFLKELWSGPSSDPETKTTYQYVLDLQNKIADTCEFAQKELAKVRDRNFRYFNKHAKLRNFKPGDQVWVLNTKAQNKFDFNWVGPATVLERRGHVIYKIQFENGTERLYHINMLKAYVSRGTSQAADKISAIDLTDKLSTQDGGDDEDETDVAGISAAVMGLVEDSDSEGEDVDSSAGIRLQKEVGLINVATVGQTETWQDVRINPELSESDKTKLWTLVEEYGDIFSDVPTPTNLIKYDIKLKSDEIIREKPYKIPVHLVDAVDRELKAMLDNGWIEKSDSSYASPMVIVKKRDSNDLRICVNYKRINSLTVIDPTPQPDIEDILAKLGKSRIYSSFDAAKGFYSIQMANEYSKNITSFVTPKECYRFTVCPFGLVNAPSIYARLTRKLLENARNLDNFVDDIIAYNEGLEGHIVTLRDLFERVRRANIKLKPSKVRIGYSELTFLGQVVGDGKVRPTDENVEKIVNAPIPRTKKGVRSLCGLVNWLRKFLPGAAKILKPLTDLTSKRCSEVVNWGPEQQAAWNEVKQILTTQPVLSLYDPTKEHVIMSDASDDYIGGSLMQREDDGELHPVMYASRKCLERESRYDIQNKEMLAIVWCCSRFYRFIYGAPFTIMTDCCALSMLNGKLSNNARVVRWQLYLQSFNFRVEVVRGKDNCVADFLTRMGT